MPSVQAQTVPYLADQESLVITFETGSFIDSSIFLDKKGMYELEMQGGNRFRLGSMTFEIPTLENADTFVTALEAKGLLKSDFAVQSEALGTLRAQADRTLQRHFRHVTGMTPNQYKQIIRALRAAEMLKAGTPAIVVAYDLGFTDQFHMSKSLKQILGQTPSEISKHT
jgi:AraC-like DNA-binding protein